MNEVTFDIVLYHGKDTKVLAVTDFIGIRVIPGRLTESGGVRLTFDPLPTPPEIPGIEITYEFKGVSVRPGAKRKVGQAGRAAATAPDVPLQPRSHAQDVRGG